MGVGSGVVLSGSVEGLVEERATGAASVWWDSVRFSRVWWDMR